MSSDLYILDRLNISLIDMDERLLCESASPAPVGRALLKQATAAGRGFECVSRAGGVGSAAMGQADSDSLRRVRVSSTHACPIGLFAPQAGSEPLVDEGWCFDAWAKRVAALPGDFPEVEFPPADWILYRKRRLEIAYAPFDWTNTNARVAFVGITPGRHQAWLAAREAALALREGATNEQALTRADRVASFGGPMRQNLVEMLDGIGLAAALGLATCDDLFGSARTLAAHLSAIAYPVFVSGTSFTGSNLMSSPVLVAIIRQVLVAQLAQAGKALVVPLGVSATAAVQLLIREGAVDARRCLLGFPHPSGANPHRRADFEAKRADLALAVYRWASQSLRFGS